jgi:hypothetical protein
MTRKKILPGTLTRKFGAMKMGFGTFGSALIIYPVHQQQIPPNQEPGIIYKAKYG